LRQTQSNSSPDAPRTARHDCDARGLFFVTFHIASNMLIAFADN
jgi:hypothetical protein